MTRPAWPSRALLARLAACCTAALALSGSFAFAQKTSEEELKTLVVPEGFEVSLYADENLIINPSAVDVDTQGRVWVAEIQFYRGRAKNPPADSIKVLEDTNGDGKADKVTTFAEGVFAPMSICVAGDKVYVATSPDLWVYEDKNHDLKADGPPTKLLTGFGGQNHDHGAHSLVLGPDHKWWMSHGDTGFNVKGVDGSHIQFQWGSMLRGELDGTKLEQIANNFRNPYEIAVDSFGESYVSDNDNDGNRSVRICWILEGGDYGWFGGPPFGINDLDKRVPIGTPYRDAWHFRGYIPGYVPGTLVTGFGSPCGMCYYEGDAFGPSYKNAPWHADAGPREVRIYRHKLDGFGMTATSENVLTTNGDNYFRPDDVCTMPDGSLVVSDWYDGGVGGHAYNDPTRGRIFRLTPKGKTLSRVGKPGPYDSIADALGGLRSPNLATQFLAREKLLAEGEKSLPELKKLLTDADKNIAARAVWVADRIGGAGREIVVEQLKSQDPAFRALGVRVLRRHGAEYADKLLPLVTDSADEVVREVLLAAGKLDTSAAFDAIVSVAKKFNGKDRYELETINIAAGSKERKEKLYAALDADKAWTLDKLQLLQVVKPEAATKLLLERLASDKLDAANAAVVLNAAALIPDPAAGRGLLALAANKDANPEVRKAALERVGANLNGAWHSLRTDEATPKLIGALLEDQAMQTEGLAFARAQGIKSLGAPVRVLAGLKSVSETTREQAIAALAELEGPESATFIRSLLTDEKPGVRGAALGALVALQDVKTLRDVLALGKSDATVQADVAKKLMGDAGGALVLLRMIDAKEVSDDVKKVALAAATNHPDSNVRTFYEKFIPEDQRPKKLGGEIKPGVILALKGDKNRGSQIFNNSSAAQCKNCHVVQGKGTSLGPDLSLIGRKFGPEAMLESILDPSKAISHEYVPYLLETTDGRVFAGFLIEKTDAQVVLKDIKGALIRVPTDEVDTLEEQKKSLMPELVLKDVTAQDAADLLAYLGSLTEGVQTLTTCRVAGPFPAGNNVNNPLEPEKNAGSPDLKAQFKTFSDRTVGWDVSQAEDMGGYPGWSTNHLCQAKKLPEGDVALYFLTVINSPSEQEVGFNVGSDDSVKVWVNGEVAHTHVISRALGQNQDRFRRTLKAGKNVVLVKVVNGNGEGGFTMNLSATQPVTFGVE